MKRLYISILILSGLLSTSLTLLADYPTGYYDRLEGKMRESLKEAAKQCVRQHTRLQYYELPNYWEYSDVYPDLVDGQKRWWEMYSDTPYMIRVGESGRSSFSRNKMQREHAVPKSWWKKNGDVEYTPAYSDMWNLYPSDASANQAKLNYPFGPTSSATFDNGVTRVGPPQRGYGGGCSNVFEPADEYKGDFARSIFYMATVYDDINWVINYMFRAEDYPTLDSWATNMLLQWSRRDPVSQKEIDRNNYVEQFQGNRNPFIDFPELAEYIWGQRTAQVFHIADQETSDPTPPITGDPEITAPLNGETLDFGQAAVGHAVTRALQISGHNLTSSLSLRVVGADKSAFIPEVSTIPANIMNQNGGYLLNITYLPTTTGTHEAKLTLYDGGLPGSIALTLRGEALPEPQLSPLTALAPTGLTASSYTARWEPAKGIADYYTLTRVKYSPGGEEAESFETGETSFTISDRDPAVAESYTVTYTRLGITSPVSNTIYVAASGLEEILCEAPIRVLPAEGGAILLRNDGESGSLSIFDATGILIVTGESFFDGDFIPLPPGIYIAVTGPGRPQKLIIR